MLSFFKKTFSKIYSQVTTGIQTLFNRTTIDEEALSELERLLIGADTGIKTTKKIIERIKVCMKQGETADGAALKKSLEHELRTLLAHEQSDESNVYLLVGINGSGKTTFASKLAHRLITENKTVLFIAADTFRAAAVAQLQEWAERLDVDIVQGKENQDPASVVFAGIKRFKEESYDAVIIDTAGRLQTKINLMKELEKITRVISAQLPDQPITTLLTVDTMLGQNSLEQARIFNESTKLDGVILTKMDGTGKGGIVFAISDELNISVRYISFGEQVEQLKLFDAREYVHDLLNE